MSEQVFNLNVSGFQSVNVTDRHGRLLLIPSMPALWDKDELIVTHKALAGALASLAIQQSPYVVPDNLSEAVLQFMSHWRHEDYARLSSETLEAEINEAFKHCPLILAWSERKNGNQAPVGSISRYEKTEPDNDFIDLEALARNVRHELVLWSQVYAAQDILPSITEKIAGAS